jgi:hypothetical protein
MTIEPVPLLPITVRNLGGVILVSSILDHVRLGPSRAHEHRSSAHV